MTRVTLQYDSAEPPVYLVQEVPGLAVAAMGTDLWRTMALEGEQAQQFMRRHGLDRQSFADLHLAAQAVQRGLEIDSAA